MRTQMSRFGAKLNFYGALLAALATVTISDAVLAARRDKADRTYPSTFQPPLTYGKDSIGVTAEGTLRARFRHWGDWEQAVKSYLADARDDAAARGTPAKKLKIGCVFLKDAAVTFPNVEGGDGKPLTGTVTTSQKYIQGMKEQCAPEFNDFIFAFTRGEVEAEWHFETLEGLKWQSDQKKNPAWSCQPRAVGDQLKKKLAKYEHAGITLWVFPGARPRTLNPKDAKQKIGPPPWGISYPAWPLFGGCCVVAGSPLAELVVHEFNHKFLDGLGRLQGVQLTMNHGLGRLAWADCGYPSHTKTDYAMTYYWIVRSDMWRRLSMEPNPKPVEAFSGKAYAWEAVKNDCWFKLPELGAPQLAKLTGLTSLKMDAQRKTNYRLYTVSDADRAKLKSPYVVKGGEADKALNNLLSLGTESAALLRTDTGSWLIVRPEMADLYVDMLKISGQGGDPLPVYGYVREGVRPLVVVKAPAESPAPGNEVGYFRRSSVGG